MAQAEIARLDALAADAAQVGNRRQRIEELIEDGLAMLTHPDTTAANAWLRQHIRVHVGRNQIDFEWL